MEVCPVKAVNRGDYMTQRQRREYLIKYLFDETTQYRDIDVPQNEEEQCRVLRSLLNLRSATPISPEFLHIQNEYLQEENQKKGITDIAELTPLQDNLYLWKGDITTLKVDAIVNAANSGMLGCFVPCHACIDNAIHTYSGVQLRLACDQIMKKQSHPEPTGAAKITQAYNLPSQYILHTVGPIVSGMLTKQDCQQLASCYRSCLQLAEQYQIKSVAFCCISTGEFHFPNDKAAEIAIQTVTQYITEKQSTIKVVFNVFRESDYEIYKRLL